jgi:hypothetical protein
MLFHHFILPFLFLTLSVNYENIVARRGAFKWLPAHPSCNDLVWGSWWFIWAGVLATITPIVPLASYANNGSLHAESTMESAVEAGYIVLIFAGVFYTVGCWAVKRAVETPAKEPLFSCYHCSNDELFGMWLFFWGTFITIPVALVFVFIDPHHTIYWLGLFFFVFFTIVMAIFVYACYPSQQENRRDICAPYLKGCVSIESRKHVQNDVIIASWVFFWGCFVFTIISFFVFIYSAAINDSKQMFDSAMFFLDMFLWTVGAMYFTAGLYPPPQGGASEEFMQPADTEKQAHAPSGTIASSDAVEGDGV